VAVVTDRRSFLKFAGIGAASTALVISQPAAAATALTLHREKKAPEHLPPVRSGDILSPRTFNDIIDRLNTLTDATA